jgi:hypothetical protein
MSDEPAYPQVSWGDASECAGAESRKGVMPPPPDATVRDGSAGSGDSDGY